MHRRTLLSMCSVGTLGLTGCLGGDAGGGFGGDESEDGADSEATGEFSDLSAAQRSFVTRLDEDIEVNAARPTSDAFVVEVQTTGDSDEDMRLAAEAYVNFVDTLETTLRVHVDDRGLRQMTFVIRTSWAEQFKAGEIDATEYLNRIADTRTE